MAAYLRDADVGLGDPDPRANVGISETDNHHLRPLLPYELPGPSGTRAAHPHDSMMKGCQRLHQEVEEHLRKLFIPAVHRQPAGIPNVGQGNGGQGNGGQGNGGQGNQAALHPEHGHFS